MVPVPACGGLFQPYGAVELAHAHALAADLALDVLLEDVKIARRIECGSLPRSFSIALGVYGTLLGLNIMAILKLVVYFEISRLARIRIAVNAGHRSEFAVCSRAW